jgi:hypothetical protein
MTKAIGVLRPVTAARRTRAIAHPPTQVHARITHRSSGDRYKPSASATPNHPTRNGQITVTYQPIPEEMS